MVAERIQLSQVPQSRQQTLLAVFLEESAAETLVARLAQLEVEPASVSVLRVALGNLPTPIYLAAQPVALLSSRYATLGIFLGGFR